MPAMIAIRIGDAALSADLAGFAAFLKRPMGLAKALGSELRNRIRGHFLQKDRYEPNKLGGDRTHYWRDVARSVSPRRISDDGTEISVDITDPTFAQKLFGGPIRANKGLYLTIPVSAMAHGKTAANLEKDEEIKLVFVAKPYGGLLIEPALAKGLPIKVHYVLKTEVLQERDETALPDEAQLQEALRDRAASYIETARKSGWNYQAPEPTA